MDLSLSDIIEKSNAGKLSRLEVFSFIEKHPEQLDPLIKIGTDLNNKNHYKAVWIIEIIAEKKTHLLLPYLDKICKTVPNYKHESAIRGMSRILFFLSTSKVISLSENQNEKIIEQCLDWLIGDIKIAPKVYAMYTLNHYAKNISWIKEELKNIINKDFAHQSAGYKAAAKEVLMKISK